MSNALQDKICVVTGATAASAGAALWPSQRKGYRICNGRSDGDGELTIQGTVAAIEAAGGKGSVLKSTMGLIAR